MSRRQHAGRSVARWSERNFKLRPILNGSFGRGPEGFGCGAVRRTGRSVGGRRLALVLCQHSGGGLWRSCPVLNH